MTGTSFSPPAAGEDRWFVEGRVMGRDELHADDRLRRRVAMLSGLGCEMWCDLADPPSLWFVSGVLADHLSRLGGDQLEADSIARRIRNGARTLGETSVVRVTLLPGRLSAGAPRMVSPEVVVEASSPEPFGPTIRVAAVPWPRTIGPSSGVPLIGDPEIAVGRRRAVSVGAEAALWVGMHGRVVSVDQAALVVRVGTVLVTPPRTDGPPGNAWSNRLVATGVLVESPIALGDVLGAEALAVVWPWGTTSAVVAVVDGGPEDPDAAAEEVAAYEGRVLASPAGPTLVDPDGVLDPARRGSGGRR